MKKLILLFVMAGPACFAQNHNDIVTEKPVEQSKFSIGVQGGYGHSFIEPYSNYKWMSSWNAGITAIYAPGAHWGAGIDVLYSGEGVKLKSGDYENMSQVDYLRIPLKAIYFFRKYEDDFRPKVSLGPTLGFKVDDYGNKGFTSFDFGANASLGFNYRLMRAVWLNVDVSYYQGFLDVYDLNDVNDHNGNVRLNVGLCLGF